MPEVATEVTTRRLATVQAINAVEPIPDADAIEKARVLGWWVVVRNGEHRPGDLVVFCEIDSLLPERPEFEFLRPGSFKPARTDPIGNEVVPAGFRIRTVKLRGQVSQGICFPLSVLPAGTPADEGADVTDALGIRKWEPPLPVMKGRVKGGFPGFLSRTDETRVQRLEGVLRRHRGRTFFVTEKLDGASLTAFLRRGEYGVCSRNLHLDEADLQNVWTCVADAMGLEEKMRAAVGRLGFDLAIQAEVIGPGIQGNKYGLSRVTLRAFNVLDLDAGRLLDRGRMLDELAAMGLDPVPQLGSMTLDHTVDELVALAEGASAMNPRIQREGIVLRPSAEEHDEEVGGRLSFKAINPKFLLKYDE